MCFHVETDTNKMNINCINGAFVHTCISKDINKQPFSMHTPMTK